MQSGVEESAGDNDDDDLLEELVLSAVEQKLLDCHLIVCQQLATPVPKSPTKGISLSQLQGLLEVTSQQYWVALYLKNSIHLLHLAFIIGNKVYTCTSKGGINPENYVKFPQDEFMSPMAGLLDPAYFTRNADLARQIPTTRDLLLAADVPSFARTPLLYELHIQEASRVARPPFIMLLSGELYHSLVLAVGLPGKDYEFKCNGVNALSHIKSVAKAEDCPERYDPWIYLLVAIAQGLNASKSGLVEVPFNFFAEGDMKQKLSVHRRVFLKYQLQDLTTQEEGFPPTVVASPHETAAATSQASRPRTSCSVLYGPMTQGGGNVPTQNQNKARSLQFMSSSLRQPSARSSSPSHSVQLQNQSSFAKSQTRPTSLPPPPPNQQAAMPLVVPPTNGTMSAVETQQMMVSIMMNVQLAQQEHQRRNDDYSDKTLLWLEHKDRRKVSWESMSAG